MTDHVHVFALNTDAPVRHTELTRARGEDAALPPLKDWIGVETLDTGKIEVFPVADLGDMALSDYVTMAFVPEAALEAETAARLDALEGTVALVPSRAFEGTPGEGPMAQEVAVIALAMADHAAQMPKADLGGLGWPGAEDDDEDEASTGTPFRKRVALVFVVLLVGFLVARRFFQ